MISYSIKSNKDAASQTRFKTFFPKGVDDFCALITAKVWSPIIWKSGFRAKDNFARCRLIVLDFDSGEQTLESIQNECNDLGLWFVLATTKSHQKKKRSSSGHTIPACDRFRLCLKAENTCIDRELYEYNMRLFPEYWPCDSSCVDGARFFWPCTKIIAHKPGNTVPWIDFDSDYVPERLRFLNNAHNLRAMGNLGLVPSWIEQILKGHEKVPVGERHKTCYRLGATWQLLGWNFDKLVSLCSKTSLRNIGDQDMIRALGNGFKANEHYDDILRERNI